MTQTSMQKACIIFIALPMDTITYTIRRSKIENREKCTMFQIPYYNLSDNNIVKHLINMLENYYKAKNFIKMYTIDTGTNKIVNFMADIRKLNSINFKN